MTVSELMQQTFQKLPEKFREHPQFNLRNAAIDFQGTPRLLYKAHGECDLPDWVHDLTSFNETHLHKHRSHLPESVDLTEAELVQCTTSDALLEELDKPRDDMLQVDGGYDYEIIEMSDVKSRQPQLINV